MEIHDDGIKELSNAIILQACKDYCNPRRSASYKSKIEEFFRSQWFGLLSRGLFDGDAIIERLKRVDSSDKSALYYRVTEKAGNGLKEQRWRLSEGGEKKRRLKSEKTERLLSPFMLRMKKRLPL